MSESLQGAYSAAVISLESRRPRNAVLPLDIPVDKPSVQILTENYILAMASLQRDNPDKDKVLVRDKTALQAHFIKAHGAAFGAKKGRDLVSMILIHENNTLPPDVRKQLPKSAHAESHSIIGGIIVSKEFRNLGLGLDLIESCLDHVRYTECAHVHARVRLGNETSLKLFQKAGFNVLTTGPSPDAPEHDVYFLHLDMKSWRVAQKKPAQETSRLYHFAPRVVA